MCIICIYLPYERFWSPYSLIRRVDKITVWHIDTFIPTYEFWLLFRRFCAIIVI